MFCFTPPPVLPHNTHGVRMGQMNVNSAHAHSVGLHNAVGAVFLQDVPCFGVLAANLKACTFIVERRPQRVRLAILLGKREGNKHTGCRSRSAQQHGTPLCVVNVRAVRTSPMGCDRLLHALAASQAFSHTVQSLITEATRTQRPAVR